MSKKRPNNKNKERQQKQNSLLHNKRVQNNNNNKSLKKRSKRSFQNTRNGATYAGRKDTQQKLAGTTVTTPELRPQCLPPTSARR